MYHTFVDDNRYSNFNLLDKKNKKVRSIYPKKVDVIISTPFFLGYVNKNRQLFNLREKQKSASAQQNAILQGQIDALMQQIQKLEAQNQSNLVKNVEGAVPTQVLSVVQANPTMSTEELKTTIQEQVPQDVIESTPSNSITETKVITEDKIKETMENNDKMDIKKLIVPALVIGAIILIIRK